MSKYLPYRATTAHGDVLDIPFRLHPDTGSSIRVNQLLDAVLRAVDREVGVLGETSNGDVLQALCMATAIRAGIIHADSETTDQLARSLLESALDSVGNADRRNAPSGHA